MKALKFNSTEVAGSTFRGRNLKFNIDISNSNFHLNVKDAFGVLIEKIDYSFKDAENVSFELTNVEFLKQDQYTIEYWAEFDTLGTEMIALERFVVVNNPDENLEDKTLNFILNTDDIDIEFEINVNVINIGGGGSDYELPIANELTLGGVKPDNISTFVDENGILTVSGSGGSVNIVKEIPFSTNIPFTNALSVMPNYNISSDTNFVRDEENAKVGSSTLIRITSNGSTRVKFYGFKLANGSSSYVNVSGVINMVMAFYDGVDYWLTIWQEKADYDVSNSTYIPSGVENNIVWDLITSKLAYDTSTNVLTKTETASSQGGYNATGYTMGANFYAVVELTGNSVSFGLDNNKDGSFASNQSLCQVFLTNGSIYASGVNGANQQIYPVASNIIKIAKVGNDAVFSYYLNNAWTQFHTVTGCFASISLVYPKTTFPSAGTGSLSAKYSNS